MPLSPCRKASWFFQVFHAGKSYHPSTSGLNGLLGHDYSASINVPGTPSQRHHRNRSLLRWPWMTPWSCGWMSCPRRWVERDRRRKIIILVRVFFEVWNLWYFFMVYGCLWSIWFKARLGLDLGQSANWLKLTLVTGNIWWRSHSF